MTELKALEACRCGGEAKKFFGKTNDGTKIFGTTQIRCLKCGLQTPYLKSTTRRAENIWNGARASTPSPQTAIRSDDPIRHVIDRWDAHKNVFQIPADDIRALIEHARGTITQPPAPACKHTWMHLHGTDKNNEYRCENCGARK